MDVEKGGIFILLVINQQRQKQSSHRAESTSVSKFVFRRLELFYSSKNGWNCLLDNCLVIGLDMSARLLVNT